jgi:hypothetical protein
MPLQDERQWEIQGHNQSIMRWPTGCRSQEAHPRLSEHSARFTPGASL